MEWYRPLPDLGGYWLTRWLFLRGLALVYLCAFLVAANQWRALCGSDGIPPARRVLEGRTSGTPLASSTSATPTGSPPRRRWPGRP